MLSEDRTGYIDLLALKAQVEIGVDEHAVERGREGIEREGERERESERERG